MYEGSPTGLSSYYEDYLTAIYSFLYFQEVYVLQLSELFRQYIVSPDPGLRIGSRKALRFE